MGLRGRCCGAAFAFNVAADDEGRSHAQVAQVHPVQLRSAEAVDVELAPCPR